MVGVPPPFVTPGGNPPAPPALPRYCCISACCWSCGRLLKAWICAGDGVCADACRLSDSAAAQPRPIAARRNLADIGGRENMLHMGFPHSRSRLETKRIVEGG